MPIDTFDDLYSKSALPWSITAGADFGWLSGLCALGIATACARSALQRLARARHRNGLRALGIATDVSTLERLVLA